MSYKNYEENPHDPYREWSYIERSEAEHDEDQRGNCHRYDEDGESSDRAYENYRNGGEFSDPDEDGRFH